MNAELSLYVDEVHRLFDRLEATIGGLDERALNWRPQVAEPNSIFVLATHILGNAEGWILGIASGQRIARDREAEFLASGKDASSLIDKARDLTKRIDAALAVLPEGALDEQRDPAQALWGVGTRHPVSVREAIMHVVEHFALHMGHIDVTKDLAAAGGGS